MANVPKSSESPANKALQHYFNDLISPQTTPLPEPNSAGYVPPDDSMQEKVSQAERLLAKANSVANLLTDSDLEPMNISAQASASEPIKTKLPTPVIHFHPADVVDIHLASAEILNSSVNNNEKNATVDKENRVNADTYNTQSNNNGQTRHLAISLKDSLPNRFQVLLCDIANVTIAIPLVELGGIHQLTQISSIAKQPSWCMGIFIKGNDKFTCIDASAWLVPKKYAATKQNSEYKYAVQLGKTPYVLCCNSISTTVEVCKDDIKWRDNTTNRPWLSGLLKERMCALIDGAQMVQDVLN
ncbi:MAG: chemotaxis signal transduction protein [Alphaproteobacteria bacterium]|jgi:chemotaxis signal transduction protein